MLSGTVRKLKQILSRHVNVSTQVIAGLIPELTYYIRWAEYIEKLQAKGYTFCKPEVLLSEEREMQAKGIYNLKLTKEDPSAIVTNDLDFDREHRIYILTGANRGGKTTITPGSRNRVCHGARWNLCTGGTLCIQPGRLHFHAFSGG